MTRGPTHVPTDDTRYLVRRMTEDGYPQAKIMQRLGLKSDHTLRKYYIAEINASQVDRELKIAETLYSIATDRNHPKCITAAIFIAKTRMGWIDATRVLIENSVTHQHQFNAAALTAEQREALRDILIAGQNRMLPAPDDVEYTEYEYEEEDEDEG